MNDSHIYSCFNQTISEFVFCKRTATDVLRTTSIPLKSTPSTSVTKTDRLQTLKPRGRVLLLLVFVTKDLGPPTVFFAETPSSVSPRFMLARPARGFPPNNAS